MGKSQKASAQKENWPNILFNKKVGVSLYVHFPFCRKKCRYCDFNSYTYQGQDQKEYLDAMLKEARVRILNLNPTTVFFGGGTPSLISPALLEYFFKKLNKICNYQKSAKEITIEANPETLNKQFAAVCLEQNINRISIGFQSIRNDILKVYDRTHKEDEAFQAFQVARKAGFKNINIDLIYSFPGQELNDWMEDLEKVCAINPDHISCYELSYEPGTALTKQKDKGRIKPTSIDLATSFFLNTRKKLKEHGFESYEVSAFAKNKKYCEHNLKYWTHSPYIGIGAGASSWLNPQIIKNINAPHKYIENILKHNKAVEEVQRCSKETIFFDRLMMGLRLEQWGVNYLEIQNAPDYMLKKINESIEKGFLEINYKNNNKFLRASKKGFLQLDSILQTIMPETSTHSV